MYLLIILQQIISSTTHIVAKSVLFDVPAPLLLLIRASIASLTFLVFIAIRKIKLFKVEKKDIPLFCILAILNIPVNQYLFFLSLKHTSPPNVALAYALSPAFVLIIGGIFLKEIVTKIKLTGIVIALLGVLFILFEKGIDLKSDNFLGNILALLAALAWALYTIIGKKFVNKYGAVYTTAIAMFFGLIFYLPVFLLSDHNFAISLITKIDWIQIIYLGVVTSGIAYVLWYMALKKLDAAKVSVFNNLQPILTTIMAIIFFNHQLTIPFVLGGLFTLLGVFITQKG